MLSKVNLILMACLVWIGGAAIFSAAAADSRSLSFNDGWRFTLADSPEMAKPEFDDSSWRSLSLPHDWAIEGDFSKDNPSGTGGGALPGGSDGIARHSHSRLTRGKNIFIDFDAHT